MRHSVAIFSSLAVMIPRSWKNSFRRTQLWHRLLPHLQPFFASLADPPYGIKREHEPDVTATIERIVKQGWTCVDVGGYLGWFSALLAELVGSSGQVIVFEAYSNNASMIRRHMRALGLSKRVHIENMAVTDGATDRVWLYYGRGDDTSEFNLLGSTPTVRNITVKPIDRVQQVPAISLDKYFTSGSRIHFIKMDIEGAEAQALPGMRRVLHEQRPAILIEFHTDQGWDAREELYAAGYNLFDMHAQLIDRQAAKVYHVLALHPDQSGKEQGVTG